MSISLAEAGPKAHAYSVSLNSESERFPGFACITIILDETREGDLPIPRFTSSYVTSDEQARKPYVIGGPNLVKDCDAHTQPNGPIVTEYGRRLDILYLFGGNETEHAGGVLFNAQGRVKERLDRVIGLLDATYRRNPYVRFELFKLSE
jgi:hypothetical protein